MSTIQHPDFLFVIIICICFVQGSDTGIISNVCGYLILNSEFYHEWFFEFDDICI